MRSTVSMMFAPGCREMMSGMLGLPFRKPAARIFSTPSFTLAISDNHRRPMVVADDERLVVFGFEKLIVGHVGGRAIIGELTLRQIRVLLAQHRSHIFEAQAETVQLSRIHIHTHGRSEDADGDRADALDLKQSLLDDGWRPRRTTFPDHKCRT